MKQMTVADLFCGAGGFSVGFKEAGFKIVFGIDNNKNACATFKENFPEAEVVCEDIMEHTSFPKVDVLIGSPPCVEFSKGNINRQHEMALKLQDGSPAQGLLIGFWKAIKDKMWSIEREEAKHKNIKS